MFKFDISIEWIKKHPLKSLVLGGGVGALGGITYQILSNTILRRAVDHDMARALAIGAAGGIIYTIYILLKD